MFLLNDWLINIINFAFFLSRVISTPVWYELANDWPVSFALSVSVQISHTQAVSGSCDINLCYYVTSFNICHHHTYLCGWLGADVDS